MSALSPIATFAAAIKMSAKYQSRTSLFDLVLLDEFVCCAVQLGMSALCHKRT
jgi:hypothetical protein